MANPPRFQFRLQTLLLGTVVCALALAVWFERRRADEATRMLYANGLAWQLADFPEGTFRVVVELSSGGPDFHVHRYRIVGRGLTKVSFHKADLPSTIWETHSAGDAVKFELTFVAHQVADRAGENLHVFTWIRSDGAVASSANVTWVAPQSRVDKNVDFTLRSGDFERGKRIDFFTQEGVDYTLLVQ